jgi:hypothetical protein
MSKEIEEEQYSSAILATGLDEVSSKEFWVVVDDASSDCSNDNKEGRIIQGLLLSDAKKKEGCVEHLFPNGCRTKKVSSLLELRDALNALIPPPSATQTPTNSIVPPESTASLDEVKRFELFRSVIEHEDELLNQRVSWIILAQSFLMAAFITADAPDSMRYVTACVGLATVIVTMPAIVAAGRNIEVQQNIYFKGIPSDMRCQQLHGHTCDLSVKDAHEMRNRFKNGHLFPNMAFRSLRAVPILYTVVALALVQFAGWISLLTTLMID